MSKRTKKKKPTRPAITSQQPAMENIPLEERRAEVATVAWMLTALLTSITESVGLCAKLYFAAVPEPPPAIAPLAFLPGVTLQIGLISGSICLILTPLVYRWRVTRPPSMVTIFAVLVSLLPLAGLILKQLIGSV